MLRLQNAIILLLKQNMQIVEFINFTVVMLDIGIKLQARLCAKEPAMDITVQPATPTKQSVHWY